MAVSLCLSVLLTNCLIFWPMASTAMSSRVLYRDADRNDVIFNDHVLFDKSDVSVFSCARHGAGAAGRSFTYTKQGSNPGHCRGYAGSFNETSSEVTPQVGAKTYLYIQLDECADINYSVLDDTKRHVDSLQCNPDDNEGVLTVTDDNLTPGWYRFKLNGLNAVMPDVAPTVPVQTDCLYGLPMWLDLEGQTLPPSGHSLVARACAVLLTSNPIACIQSLPVTVRNCGHYYIYFLQPPEHSWYYYLATEQV